MKGNVPYFTSAARNRYLTNKLSSDRRCVICDCYLKKLHTKFNVKINEGGHKVNIFIILTGTLILVNSLLSLT